MTNKKCESRCTGLTLLEMVIALSLMSGIFAVILPQFTLIRKSWDSKQGSSEALQNGRVLTDHIHRNLISAQQITSVSLASEINGYIEFIDSDGVDLRYQVVSGYVQFGEVGSLSDLAGPASKLQFTCYAIGDVDTPITDAESVRLVKVDTTLTNLAESGRDMDFSTSAFVQSNAMAQSQSDKIYWADESKSKISCSNLDGSNIEDVLSTVIAKPKAMAIDLIGGKIYWADEGLNKILRVNIDGTNVVDIVIGTVAKPRGLDLDIPNGKMYWVDETTAKIYRSNLDGSSIEDIISGVKKPRALTLDLTNGKIYFADESDRNIYRSNLDGSNVETIVSNVSKPKGLALDVDGGKIYWGDDGANKISRANLDGSSIEDIISGVKIPKALSLDLIDSKIYWADGQISKIQRADLDGFNIEDIVSDLLLPTAVVIGRTGHQEQILP